MQKCHNPTGGTIANTLPSVNDDLLNNSVQMELLSSKPLDLTHTTKKNFAFNHFHIWPGYLQVQDHEI